MQRAWRRMKAWMIAAAVVVVEAAVRVVGVLALAEAVVVAALMRSQIAAVPIAVSRATE